ncbi:MAG: OmpA family protein [Chitinophagales bacterium]
MGGLFPENAEVISVRITGYTDSVGTEASNIQLAQKRAEYVAGLYTKFGVPKDSIFTDAKGGAYPFASNATDSGRALNRRVDVLLTFYYPPEPDDVGYLPAAFAIKPAEFKIDPNKEQDLALDNKGSVLHVPANAFLDVNGKTVQKEVTLLYTTYREQAEFAFSNLPMTYTENGTEYRFNSAGMFSLYGKTNDEVVFLDPDKPMLIDFAVEQANNIAFYSLGEKNKWRKVQDISRKSNVHSSIQTNQNNTTGYSDKIVIDFAIMGVDDHGDYIYWNNEMQAPMSKRERDSIVGANPAMRGVPDEGNPYPDVITGLKLEGFGVYNCDEVYTLADHIKVIPVFRDAQGGLISDPAYLSVIDLQYNGAFCSSPQFFICSKSDRNVLLLITNSKKVYLLSADDFAQTALQNGRKTTFTMQDYTDRIRSSEDLAGWLKGQ